MSRDLHNDYQPEAFQGIDFDKLKNISRRSLAWIVIIFIITNLAAYLVLRWTKPVYISQSELKLELKSDASELGIGFIDKQNINVLSGEIELIKSRLFFNQVIESLDLDISYYTVGKVLTDEKYKSSPFKVEAYVKSPSVYDKKFYIELQNDQKLLFSFDEDFKTAKQYSFDEIIATSEADFKISLNRSFDEGAEFRHYFVMNSHEALLNYIEKNITVEPINVNANTIRISFKDHNKMKAHDLVNAIDTIYLRFSNQEKSQENNQKIEYLDHQLSQIENLLENYENYFENFTLQYRTSDLGEDLKQTLLMINELDSQEYVLSRRLEVINATAQSLNNKPLVFINPRAELPPALVEYIEQLNVQLEELEKMKLFYKETTNAYSMKSQKIESAVNSLLQQLTSSRVKITENLREITRRKDKLEASFAQIPGKSTEYNKKQRFFKLYEEFYLGLMETKAQFEIAQAGTTPDFKILSPASMPLAPISPNKVIIHGIGIVSGLIFGFLLIAFRYLISNKILSISELEKLTQNAILGSVPALYQTGAARMVVQDQPRSAVSESLRTVRTNIEFMLAGKKNKIISVTSTIGGEGKTFIAANLSAIISLSKRKVVVVDFDLRKPKVHEAFGESNSAKGVSTILINKHSVDECIRATEIQHLDYIPAGPTPPNPSELLLNGEFSSFLEELSGKYDLVVLDTPPVGVVTDGILVMSKVDLPIYVFRANYSKKEFLKNFNRIQKVNNIKNMAVILNAVPVMLNSYYGSGYYEEKSKSGTFNKIKMIFSNT